MIICDAILCDSNDVLTIETLIGNEKITTLMDTGASRNYISKSMVEDLLYKGIDVQLKVLPNSIRVKVANNSTLDVTHEGTLSLSIDKRIIKTNFVIMDSLLYELILGYEFCRANNVIIDLHQSTISFSETNSYLIMVNEERVIVPPYSERILESSCNINCDGIYEFSNCNQPIQNVILANGIIELRASRPNHKVIVANLSKQAKVLKRGDVIGLVKPVQTDDICCIEDCTKPDELTTSPIQT